MEASLDNKFPNQNQNKNQDRSNEQKSNYTTDISTKMRPKNDAGQIADKASRTVEDYAAKVPSLGYLGIAVGAMAASAAIATFTRRKELANFVGMWAPSILMIGLYNKISKMEHELEDRASNR